MRARHARRRRPRRADRRLSRSRGALATGPPCAAAQLGARGALSTALLPAAAAVRGGRRGPAPAVRARLARVGAAAGAGDRRRQPGRRRRRQDADGDRRRRAAAPQRLHARHRLARLRPQRRAASSSSVRDASAREVGDEPLLMQRRTGVPVVVGARPRRRRARAAARASRGRRHRQRRRPAAPGARRATSRCWCSTSAASATAGCCRPGRCASRCPRRWAPRQLVLYNADAPTTPLPGYLAQRAAGRRDAARRDWWHGAAPSRPALEALRDRAARRRRRHGAPGALLRDAARRGPAHRRARRSPTTPTSRRCPGRPARRDVVVTEKDAVKLAPARPLGTRVWVARLDFVPEPGLRRRAAGAAAASLTRSIRMETRLLELLVCPLCKGPLQHWRPPQHDRQELVCSADGWPSRCATASR